jgi:tRNA-specific 2-thiouridylase
MQRFADSYVAGETPVPCIACNQSVKFADLLTMAREIGARALVTGHYVRWRRLASGPALFRARDAARDQSYFLFSTPPDELDFVRFPLGGLAKPSVRRLANALGLAVAEKPDSQDICFVPAGRYTDIVARLRPDAGDPGEIVHIDGRQLGRHAGIMHFTVGQRRGLGIASGEPLYVVALDAGRRRVVVGPRSALLVDRIRLRDVSWLAGRPGDDLAWLGGDLHARVRSTQPPRPAALSTSAGSVEVLLAEGEYGVARGQACVLYSHGGHDARLLGGGWIAEARNGDRPSAQVGAPTAASVS